MSGIPIYEPLFHALRRRNIDVLYCTVIGTFCEAHGARNAGRSPEPGAARPSRAAGAQGRPAADARHDAGALRRRRRRRDCRGCTSSPNRRARSSCAGRRGSTPDFVEVSPEGVDLSRFEAQRGRRARRARAQWGLADGDAVVTSVARLSAMKGLDNLLLAAPRVLERHAQRAISRRRRRRQRQRLIALARSSRSGRSGPLPRATWTTCRRCSPRATSSAIPSLAEGLPNAIVEAMASGVPVVASDVGGIPEAVSHEDTGLLVPPHDIKAIAGSLEQAARLAGRSATRLAASGRRVARERFDLQRNLERLVRGSSSERARRRLEPTRGSEPVGPAREPDADRRALPDERAPHRGRGDRARDPVAIPRSRALPASTSSACIRSTTRHRGAPSRPGRRDRHALPRDGRRRQGRATCGHLIRSRRIRVVVACQDTRLAYRVFQGLNPAECSLVEHGGVVEEAFAIPKDRTVALRRSVEGDPRRGGQRRCRIPRTRCTCRAWSTPRAYAGPRPRPAARRLRLRARRVRRHLRRAARSEETGRGPARSGAPAAAAISAAAGAGRRRPRCVPARLRASSCSQRYGALPGPAHHLRRASRRRPGDPDARPTSSCCRQSARACRT